MTKKSIIAVLVVMLSTVGLLIAQNQANSVSSVNITKQEMESWFKTMPPEQLRAMANSPDAKKQIVDNLKELFSLSQEAERLGITAQPEVQSDLAVMEQVVLATLYRNRKAADGNPDSVKITDEQKNDYFKRNPKAFDQFMSQNPKLKAMPPEQRETIKPQFAELMINVERAKAEKLDQDPGVQMARRIQRASYLAQRAQQKLREVTQVTDEDMQKQYDSQKQEFEETRARHILVMLPEQREQSRRNQPENPAANSETNKPKTNEEARALANDLLKRVKAGEDFQKLAKEYSDDTASAVDGGELGYFRKDVRFVPPFKEAVFKLKPGEVSEVVETQFGFHIIKVEDRRIAPLDETLKAELKDGLVDKKLAEKIESLKAKNTVTIDESFTLPAAPPAPPAPTMPTMPGQGGPNANPENPHGAPQGAPQGKPQSAPQGAPQGADHTGHDH